jgi:hypothetical protein
LRPENFVLFNRSDRSKDGYYVIPGGVNHVFSFQIFPRRHSNITMSLSKMDPPAQQFSVHVWLSRRPLDKILFEDNPSLNPVKLTLIPKSVVLWDFGMPDLDLGNLTLDPMLTYYVNVRNMQSAENAYQLLLPR